MKRNNSFDAYVGKCIRGHVLDYIKKWNRGGVTGTDTRANRALFSDPNLDAEELAKKARISLKAAEKAIDCAELERVHYDTTESSRYDDDTGRSQSFQDGEVSAEFRAKYSCCDKYSLSPQLKILRRSEKTTWDDEKAFRQLRNAPQADLVKRAGIMARFDQYREPSVDIRNAKTNREWQKQNWFLEPDFSDDHDYRPSKSEQRMAIHVRPSSQTISSPAPQVVVLESRGSGVKGLHVCKRHNPTSISERSACSRIVGRR